MVIVGFAVVVGALVVGVVVVIGIVVGIIDVALGIVGIVAMEGGGGRGGERRWRG